MKRGMGKGAYLGGDGDGRVDGVGDDAEHGLGARLGARSDEVAHDRAVGVEEIVTGHAGLARHASGDHHNLFSPNTVRMVGQRAAMALLSFGLGGLAAGPHKASRGKSARVRAQALDAAFYLNRLSASGICVQRHPFFPGYTICRRSATRALSLPLTALNQLNANSK